MESWGSLRVGRSLMGAVGRPLAWVPVGSGAGSASPGKGLTPPSTGAQDSSTMDSTQPADWLLWEPPSLSHSGAPHPEIALGL